MSKISIFVATFVCGFAICQTIFVIILMNESHWDISNMDRDDTQFCIFYLLSIIMAMTVAFVVGTLMWLTGGEL